MRDAGLEEAVKSLGLGFQDYGDIDFTTVTGHDKPGASRHYSVEDYREWLRSGTHHNFAAWVRSRNPKPTKNATAPLAVAAKRSHTKAFGTVKNDHLNVVNAELMGGGLRLVHEAVREALARQVLSPFILTIGGDHSIASGTISALIAKYPSLGVIWVDAHADANTPRSSPSGHYHGMPAAHLLGWFEHEPGEGVAEGTRLPGFEWFAPGCLTESRLAYIGLRDVDPEEGRMLRRSGVRVFTMRDVDKYGIARVVEMAIEATSSPTQDNPLHLSLDIDSVDPHFAPGTGTTARGGLSYREIHYICEECAMTRRLVSMDLVEVNPGLDPPPTRAATAEEGVDSENHQHINGAMHGDHPAISAAASPTVRLALELVLSALGKQIC